MILESFAAGLPGTHQPLIVKDGDTAAGFLRFGNFSEEIRKGLL